MNLPITDATTFYGAFASSVWAVAWTIVRTTAIVYGVAGKKADAPTASNLTDNPGP